MMSERLFGMEQVNKVSFDKYAIFKTGAIISNQGVLFPKIYKYTADPKQKKV